jgi:hypothetical protein
MDSQLNSCRCGARAGGIVTVAACVAVAAAAIGLSADQPAQPAPGPAPVHFPTIPAEHEHARALLENALALFAPAHKMVDPASGYPLEGWNHDPEKGLFMRSYTQLTAIALWLELLGNVAAGPADTPQLSREQALTQLAQLVKTLRQDQRDPRLSADGLLSNFLDLATDKRCGPLVTEVDKHRFLDALGREKGEAAWKALAAKGWIVPRPNDRSAVVHRGPRYGAAYFDEALAPYADPATKEAVLAILDQRVVLAVFGDNANLSIAAAKTIGALLHPEVKDRPLAMAIRKDLEQFLENQKPGYTRLYDPEVGLFYFGRDATRDRMFGWEDLQGKWKTGHMDYLVNEFRAPATFVVLRYGLPVDAVANLGFKIKPYRAQDGRDIWTLAPWDGSAFQVLGLNLSLRELQSTSWRRLLENAVAIEIDFATHKKLPGFLSESYTGEGTHYTGEVGIPDIAVTPKPRITDCASLYTLGTAYSISPSKVEKFLAANWPVVSKLRTDHGPWEGFNITRQEPIRIQTSAHTLSLILGMLGTGPEHMQRYLDSRQLGDDLTELFKPGEPVNWLSEATQVFAWADQESTIQSTRRDNAFQVKSDLVHQVGIAFVAERKAGVNLSGGLLRLRYRCSQTLEPMVIALKPATSAKPDARIIATEIFSRFADTGGQEEEICIPLPATPGLRKIKEVVLTVGPGKKRLPVDLQITHFSATPLSP